MALLCCARCVSQIPSMSCCLPSSKVTRLDWAISKFFLILKILCLFPLLDSISVTGLLMSPQDLLEVVCTMKPVHGSLNPCPDKHGIGNPLVYEPRGLSFLICERGGHTTNHKGTCMKDPAGPSSVATLLPSRLPFLPFQPSYPSPALSHYLHLLGTSLLPLALPSAPLHSRPLSSTPPPMPCFT